MTLSRAMGLWPGLIPLWYRGEASGLAASLLFATVLDITIAATFYWPVWLHPWLVRVSWAGLAAVSIFSFAHACFNRGRVKNNTTVDVDSLFKEAQRHYLCGEYFEAEATLHKIFAQGFEDMEAAIMMVSILRRTGRHQQALKCIEQLELVEPARKWLLELQTEKRQIEVSIASS